MEVLEILLSIQLVHCPGMQLLVLSDVSNAGLLVQIILTDIDSTYCNDCNIHHMTNHDSVIRRNQ